MAKRRDYQPIYDNTYQRQRRHFWWGVGLFLICVIVGGLGWWQWQAYQRRQLSNYPIQGVVINQDSGYLDFQQLAKHEKFAYLQATSGATYTDDAYGDNFSRSQGADIAVGVEGGALISLQWHRENSHSTGGKTALQASDRQEETV